MARDTYGNLTLQLGVELANRPVLSEAVKLVGICRSSKSILFLFLLRRSGSGLGEP